MKFCNLKIFIIFIYSLSILMMPFQAGAEEVELGISRTTFTRIPIGLMDISDETSYGDNKLAMEVLRDDLEMSELFQIIDLSRLGIDTASKEEPAKEFIQKAGRFGITLLVWGKLFWKDGYLALEGRMYDAASGELISGKRYLGERHILRKMTHRLSDEIVYRYTGERGIAQTQIAYIGEFSGKKELFLMDYDGYNPVRITADRGIKLSPSWSPDGRLITYTSYHEGNPNIYNLDTSTSRKSKLIGFEGLNISPAWSPDGEWIAFSSSKDGNSELYLADKNGTHVKRLTFGRASDISPTWSPSGNELAFVSDRGGEPQVYVMDKEGTNVRRLTFQGSYNTSPKWSPLGDLIVYTCRKGDRMKLCVISPDGAYYKQLTYGTGNDEFPSWAPNGRLILFSTQKNRSSKIFSITPEGMKMKEINNGNAFNTYPSWSPAGIK